MRVPAILFAALLLSSCEPAPTQPTNTFAGGDRATVVSVLDGDSLLAEVDGQEIEVRLLGINAPERSECHGDEARAALERLTSSGEITLIADNEDVDRFGRALRYVYAGAVEVNIEMLSAGSANVIQTEHRRNDQFVAAADRAAAAQVGMWEAAACGSSQPIPDVAIADVVYNPPGRDSDNPNGEWVAVTNSGDTRIEMGGWILRDESTQHRYRFPSDFVLAPGEEIRVHSGCGSDTPADLYWCAQDPVWSNGGDTAIVQLADGTVVARRLYTGDF